MAVERTLILAKSDAVVRGLAGEILARFERRGLKLRAARFVTAGRELGETHYAEHREKPFYGELVDFITSGPLVAMVLEGESAITAARQVIGATNPLEASPGSIRGDYAVAVGQNMVHGSDSPESAAREIGIWFPELSPSSLGRSWPGADRPTWTFDHSGVWSPFHADPPRSRPGDDSPHTAPNVGNRPLGSAQGRVAPGSLRVTSGEELIRAYDPGDGGFLKLFCSQCGSALWSRSPEDPEVMSVRLGVLDSDPGIRPSYRQFVAYAGPGEPLPDDGLRRYSERSS